MEEPYLTILAIAINTLITYFLLNRQEKRLAQKLFQDQVKFKMLHEKRVETLENLYKKFVVFNKTLEPIIRDLIRRNSSTKTKGMVWVDESDLEPFDEQAQKLDELSSYFDDNRIFLPDNAVKLISNIISNARFPYFLVTDLWFFLSEVKFHFDEHKLLSLFSKLINNSITADGRGFAKIDLDHPDLVRLFEDIVFRMHADTRVLENIYKSVAHTEDI